MEQITIRAKTFPKEQLPGILKEHNIFINSYAEELFKHKEFRTDSFPDEVQVVIASLEELGFQNGATLGEIFSSLPEHRLKPCHVNTGLFLRLAWKEQEQSADPVLTGTHRAPDKAVTVLSHALESDDAFPKGLYLRNVEGKLWLRGYVCDMAYRWSAGDLFAFEI